MEEGASLPPGPVLGDEAGLLDLLHQMERLKHLPRTGWVDRAVERPESVAAHSWRLATLSWLLAQRRGLDAARAVTLALVHDLPEALTGDLLPFGDGLPDPETRRRLALEPPDPAQWRTPARRAAKLERERAALEATLAGAPDWAASAIRAAWEEYEQATSPEAQLVQQLDKLEAYLQGWEYARDGRIAEPRTLTSFQVDTDRLVLDPELRAVLAAIEAWSGTAHAPSTLSGRSQQPPAGGPPEPTR